MRLHIPQTRFNTRQHTANPASHVLAHTPLQRNCSEANPSHSIIPTKNTSSIKDSTGAWDPWQRVWYEINVSYIVSKEWQWFGFPDTSHSNMLLFPESGPTSRTEPGPRGLHIDTWLRLVSLVCNPSWGCPALFSSCSAALLQWLVEYQDLRAIRFSRFPAFTLGTLKISYWTWLFLDLIQ